jgi:hypothetical protein
MSSSLLTLLWGLVFLSGSLTAIVWLLIFGHRISLLVRIAVVLVLFIFGGAFYFATSALSEIASSRLAPPEVARFAMHLATVRWLVGLLTGSTGIRILFMK